MQLGCQCRCCNMASLCYRFPSCYMVQDPAELWNNDSLQVKELFEALTIQHTANCLSDNRHSAVTCSVAKWNPEQSYPRPAARDTKANTAAASQQAAALKTAVDKIVSGMPCFQSCHSRWSAAFGKRQKCVCSQKADNCTQRST